MKFKPQIVILILVFCIGLVSCKSVKTIAGNGILNASVSAKQIIKNSNKSNSEFSTFSGKVKINVTESDKSKSYTLKLRMQKDSTIMLMSSPITVVKAIITPNRVAFYNKLDGTYFDGDFSYLSELLGTELDFYKVQALLLGEPIFKPNTREYEATVFGKSYMLKPKKQDDLFELFLLFNPTHYKMDSQQIAQSKVQRLLEINYLAYQNIDKEILPERIKIIAVEKDNQLKIDLDFKGIELNKNLRFPFKIPSGYDQIILK